MTIVADFHPSLLTAPEVVQVSRETGRSRREVACLLLELWVWVAEHGRDGWLEGFAPEMLVWVIDGTDTYFWDAAVAAGLLRQAGGGLVVPSMSGRVRQSRQGPRPLAASA